MDLQPQEKVQQGQEFTLIPLKNQYQQDNIAAILTEK
jgi:hypothetical protein